MIFINRMHRDVQWHPLTKQILFKTDYSIHNFHIATPIKVDHHLKIGLKYLDVHNFTPEILLSTQLMLAPGTRAIWVSITHTDGTAHRELRATLQLSFPAAIFSCSYSLLYLCKGTAPNLLI